MTGKEYLVQQVSIMHSLRKDLSVRKIQQFVRVALPSLREGRTDQHGLRLMREGQGFEGTGSTGATGYLHAINVM